MKQSLVVGLLFAVFGLRAQLLTIINNDTSICVGQSLTLQATLSQMTTINPVTVFGPPSSDDSYSNLVPLGFTFNFFGNNYTSVAISSNGYIRFGTGGGGWSQWSIQNASPSPANPTNAIYAPWADVFPGLGGQGTVRYKTIGTAPNRIFVVEYLDNPVFSSSCSQFCYATQIKLFESTNIVETHIANYQSCSSWNQGRAIHGIQNAAGNVAFIVPGRNSPAQWSAQNDGYRWTPTGPNNYTMQPIAFNPTFMPANIPPNQIQWLANGTVVGTGLSINVSPTQNTQYIVRFQYSAQCANSFSFADTVNVTVGNLPLTVTPNQTICAGDSVQLTAQPNIPVSNVTYLWSPNTNLSSTNTSSTWASPASTTTYSVQVSSPSCNATQNVTVTVNPLPTIQLSPQNPAICPGTSIMLTAAGASTYQWSPSTGLSNPSVATPDASPNSTTTYTVTGVNANGCQNNASITLTVHPSPSVNLIASAPGICLQDSVQLIASGAQSYVWSNLPGGITPSTPNVWISPQASGAYWVSGTDANGCVDSAQVAVTVHPLPNVDFNPLPASACVPATITWTDMSTVGSGNIVSWNWLIDGHGTSGSATVPVNYNFPGAFGAELTVTTNQGCSATLRRDSVAFARPNPTAAFSYSPELANIGDPSYQFIDESSSDVVNWFWTFGDIGTAAVQNPFYNFGQIGEFWVNLQVSNQYGCTDETGTEVRIEGISEIWIPSAFTPNGDGLNDTFFPIGTNLTDNVTLEVLVYDRWGKMIYQGSNPNNPWDGTCETLVNCPVGSYSYRVIFINEKNKYQEFMGKVALIR
jgi:gliding motility-associated-like protein